MNGKVATIECVQFQPSYHERLVASVVSIDYHSDSAVQTIRQAWEAGVNEVLYERP